jgi:predicted ABC-type ATPase
MFKKHFIIIAGPNGAGKSTSSKGILKEYQIEAFDWDKHFENYWKSFSYDSNPTLIHGISDRVTSEFEEHLNTAFNQAKNVAYETNFHTDFHFTRNTKAKTLGYRTSLIFFLISSPDICEHRVAMRVSQGGHYVDRATIDYRFNKGLENLNKAVLEFDAVLILDSSKDFQIEVAAMITDGKVITISNNFPKELKSRLSNIYF